MNQILQTSQGKVAGTAKSSTAIEAYVERFEAAYASILVCLKAANEIGDAIYECLKTDDISTPQALGANKIDRLLSKIDDAHVIAATAKFNFVSGDMPSYDLVGTGSTDSVIIASENMELNGPILKFDGDYLKTLDAKPAAQRALLDECRSIHKLAFNRLLDAEKKIKAHTMLLKKMFGSQNAASANIQDKVQTGMTSDAAKLKALQIQQELNEKAVPVASGAPTSLLKLFSDN